MRSLLIAFSIAASLAHCVAAGAQASGEYATDLAAVYGGYQRMLAMKAVCDAATPAARAANDKAFASWEARHRTLLQDLQRRVTAMIRRASQDEKEYARNLGKYEGAILQERLEYQETLTALGASELREQCQRMPEMLKSPDANFANFYAAELETIRKRK